jgi:hypothetical protein
LKFSDSGIAAAAALVPAGDAGFVAGGVVPVALGVCGAATTAVGATASGMFPQPVRIRGGGEDSQGPVRVHGDSFNGRGQ